jgi:nicotinate phosphoribosyltransferase
LTPALLTDLYELTMAAGYFDTGRASEHATFELGIRRVPRNRNYVIAAGLEQALDYLSNLRFTAEEIAYLRSLSQFTQISKQFFDYLREFRFRGDVWAAPEGTVLFGGEPMMIIRANIIEAQIPETYLLAVLTFPTLVATKASRIVTAAQGRSVVEFGTRRAHTAEAGVLGARAAYIGGCSGTSNTQAGFKFGVPVVGTAAHSWVMSFPTENEAFARLQQVLGPSTIQLVDTYDTEEGVRRAVALGKPLWGIRLDSGDLQILSRDARSILDAAGMTDVKIMVSSDLDEYRIRDLLAAGAPIDSFGVGTELAVSGDAPAMSTVYKLVEMDGRPTAKWSEGKRTWPGRKQIYRFPGCDRIALSDEQPPAGAHPVLEHVMSGGQRTQPAPSLSEIRARARKSLESVPEHWRRLEQVEPYPVEHSQELLALAGQAWEMVP